MKLLRLLTTIMLLALLTACQAPVRPDAGIAPPPAAGLAAGAILIDVRTQAEWQEGHLQGALNIPYEKIGAEIARVAPDKQTRIELYCKSGRRSGIALETLRQLGYGNAVNNGSVGEASEKLKIPVVK